MKIKRFINLFFIFGVFLESCFAQDDESVDSSWELQVNDLFNSLPTFLQNIQSNLFHYHNVIHQAILPKIQTVIPNVTDIYETALHDFSHDTDKKHCAEKVLSTNLKLFNEIRHEVVEKVTGTTLSFEKAFEGFLRVFSSISTPILIEEARKKCLAADEGCDFELIQLSIENLNKMVNQFPIAKIKQHLESSNHFENNDTGLHALRKFEMSVKECGYLSSIDKLSDNNLIELRFLYAEFAAHEYAISLSSSQTFKKDFNVKKVLENALSDQLPQSCIDIIKNKEKESSNTLTNRIMQKLTGKPNFFKNLFEKICDLLPKFEMINEAVSSKRLACVNHIRKKQYNSTEISQITKSMNEILYRFQMNKIIDNTQKSDFFTNDKDGIKLTDQFLSLRKSCVLFTEASLNKLKRLYDSYQILESRLNRLALDKLKKLDVIDNSTHEAIKEHSLSICSNYIMLKNNEIARDMVREVLRNVTQEENFFKNVDETFCEIFLNFHSHDTFFSLNKKACINKNYKSQNKSQSSNVLMAKLQKMITSFETTKIEIALNRSNYYGVNKQAKRKINQYVLMSHSCFYITQHVYTIQKVLKPEFIPYINRTFNQLKKMIPEFYKKSVECNNELFKESNYKLLEIPFVLQIQNRINIEVQVVGFNNCTRHELINSNNVRRDLVRNVLYNLTGNAEFCLDIQKDIESLLLLAPNAIETEQEICMDDVMGDCKVEKILEIMNEVTKKLNSFSLEVAKLAVKNSTYFTENEEGKKKVQDYIENAEKCINLVRR